MKQLDQNSSNSIDAGITWRKSTFSNPNGACVEVAEQQGSIVIKGQIHVRDSKHPKGSVLLFTEQEWEAFVSGVQQGEFDLQ